MSVVAEAPLCRLCSLMQPFPCDKSSDKSDYKEAGSELCEASDTSGMGTNSVVCTSSGHVESHDLCSRNCLSKVILSVSSS